jgi:cytochrome c5
MTVTRAMTPAKCLACGLATNTVTVDGCNTHERASWGCRCKTLVTTAINGDRKEGTVGGSMNSSEDDVKETLVVNHNKRVETSISERESVSVNCRS